LNWLIVTVTNWILHSRQLASHDRDSIVNALTPFVSRKELSALATVTEDVCIAFGASFVDGLRLNEFTNPVSALSHFLDLTDDSSKAISIVQMPQLSREKALLDASKAAQAGRFANGPNVSSLLAAFRPL
jgi:hypothetical protein